MEVWLSQIKIGLTPMILRMEIKRVTTVRKGI